MRWISFVLFCIFASPAAAQSGSELQQEEIDPIACVVAVFHLPRTVRSHMQLQCLALPLKVCTKREAGAPCLDKSMDAMRRFYQAARPLLPNEIDAKGFAKKSYLRYLARADEAFGTGTNCNEATPLDTAVCQYQTFMSQTMNLFYAVRLADIDPQSIAY